MIGARGERLRRLARSGPLARVIGFWWGLAEGLAFFIVPDVYIAFATLFSPLAGAVAWVFSIAGSVAAVCAIYLLTETYGAAYLAFLTQIPGIPQPMIEQVSARIAADGLPYTPLLALGGVPLKVYAGAAFSLGVPFALVLMWTVFARVVRIAPTFLVAGAVRALLGRRIDERPALWAALLVCFWVAFYVFYFARVTGTSAPS